MNWVQILPYVVSVIGFSAFWLIPRHPFGWGVAIVSQVFYIPFIMLTHEWGFGVHAILYGSVFIRNFIYDERHPRIQEQIATGQRKSKGKAMV